MVQSAYERSLNRTIDYSVRSGLPILYTANGASDIYEQCPPLRYSIKLGAIRITIFDQLDFWNQLLNIR